MLDFSDPYLPFIALSYGLAFVVLVGIALVQRHLYRKVCRQLDYYKDTL